MGVIAAAVAVGIVKGVAKLLFHDVSGGAVPESVVTELAGVFAKGKPSHSVKSLVSAYVGSVEDHPEFHNIPENDREAVKFEVTLSLNPALDSEFLKPLPYDSKRVVKRLYELRGHGGKPVGLPEAATALYQQSLDAAVRAVIVVAEASKGWQVDDSKAIHAKLDDLAEKIEASATMQEQILGVLEFVEQTVADLRAEKYLERRAFLERYYRAIRNTLDRMELYGLDVKEDHPARLQRLSVAYISLNLTAKDGDAKGGSLSWESVLDSLEPGENGRLLIRGDAGMGKTTLLRWAAIAIARQSESWKRTVVERFSGGEDGAYSLDARLELSKDGRPCKLSETWRGKVPLLIVLRECTDGRFPEPQKLPTFVSKAVGDAPEGFVRWLLDHGKALVMIDGLDEVPPGDPMKRISTGISDLLNTDGDRGNFFLATSRPLVEDPGWIKKLHFREAVIAPMTDPERDALIDKWHRAVADQTPNAERRAQIEAMPADLINQLNQRPAIARLATVPLLCAMICAQSGPLGSKLPESEFAIINKLAEAMLWVRDKDREVPPTGTPWDELKEDKRLAVAARLAHFLISQTKAAVTGDSAKRKIADALRFAGRTEADAKREAEAVLYRMCDRGGVLRRTADGLIEFVHKTFCEFLSAYQFVEDQETLFLGEHAPEPGPSNVCRYAAGVKNRKYTEELINRVLSFRDSKETRGVVALRMALSAPTLDPKVHARVKEIEAEIVPPHTAEQAKAIADLGDDVVDRLAFRAGDSVPQQIMNAMALSQIRSSKAIDALKQYAPSADNLSLIELLCRGVNPLMIPLVRRALTEPYNVYRVRLSVTIRSQINDASVTEWIRSDENLGAVAWLDLLGTKVTDAGVKELARPDTGLKSLTRLNLEGTQVTDEGVKELARADTGLKSLTDLILDGTQVTDAGVKELARADTGLKSLTSLDLIGTQVTDEGVKELARAGTGLSNLNELLLCGTSVTSSGIRELARADTGLRNLKYLQLDRTNIGDEGVAALSQEDSGLRKLEVLFLAHTAITEYGVLALTHPSTALRALKELHLWFTTLDDGCCTALARADTGLKSLAILDLWDTRVTDAGVKELARADTGLKSLIHLDLGGTGVTDTGVKELARVDSGLKSLTTLNLKRTRISDVAVNALTREDSGLKALATLDIANTRVSKMGKAKLRQKGFNLGIPG